SAARRGPLVALLVERVVDPRKRACTGEGFDRVELPVGVAAADGPLEAQEGQAGGQSEQMGEVVLGPLFPAARPDELEIGPQAKQVSGRGGRKEMRNALDRMERALGSGAREVAREQRDDPVDVHHQQRPGHLRHRSVYACGGGGAGERSTRSARRDGLWGVSHGFFMLRRGFDGYSAWTVDPPTSPRAE